MHSPYNRNDVRVFFGGQQIGEMETLKVERESINEAIQGKSDCPLCDAGVPLTRPRSVAINVSGNLGLNREALMGMMGFDYSQLELRILANPLDIRVRTKGMPARCNKMTKNRRIRRKWAKRYGLPKTTLYKNCHIMGYSERIQPTADHIMALKYERKG